MLQRAFLALAVAFLAGGPTGAQEVVLSGLQPGDRIRVTSTDGVTRMGLFVSCDEGLLVWKPGGFPSGNPEILPVHQSFSELQRVELSRGRQRLGRGVFWKVVGGFTLAGGLAAAAVSGSCTPGSGAEMDGCVDDPARAFLAGAMIGGVIWGLPIGAVASLIRREVWSDVGIPRLTPQLQALPDGRFGIGFSLPTGR
jgi:hypothetical protein